MAEDDGAPPRQGGVGRKRIGKPCFVGDEHKGGQFLRPQIETPRGGC